MVKTVKECYGIARKYLGTSYGIAEIADPEQFKKFGYFAHLADKTRAKAFDAPHGQTAWILKAVRSQVLKMQSATRRREAAKERREQAKYERLETAGDRL